jgi:hypothetical protein
MTFLEEKSLAPLIALATHSAHSARTSEMAWTVLLILTTGNGDGQRKGDGQLAVLERHEIL